jgi:preprotein translocase subunit SecA
MVQTWPTVVYSSLWGLNEMTFSTHSIPRPGLALGRYPERREPSRNKLDDLLDRTTARLASRWESRASCFERVVSQIDQAGRLLSYSSEDELSGIVINLRARLVRAGWDDTLAIEAFAVIREIAGRVLDMRHFNSQLLGGWAMYHGQIAEMQTGEGKTLSATLPAATAALAGIPVHIITTNDYLASRDAELIRPLYEALGLTVGFVGEGMDFSARCDAYACDVTYTTNKQVCFDYLRDRVERGSRNTKLQLNLERLYDDPARKTQLMLRGLCFAIVDEADSVLIDEARVPLVLSRTIDSDKSEQVLYQQALALADELTQGEDYIFLEGKRQLFFTPNGSAHLTHRAVQMSPQWRSLRRREELVLQALSAQLLFIRDRDYVVRDDAVQIVDGNTGRVMADRTWERGLHHMVEAKEHCVLSGDTETLARISYQRFFRRYLRLSGMTGTASEVERELGQVYGLNVTRIAPHRLCRRIAMPERVFVSVEHVQTAVIASVRKHVAQGRPVLVGTRSVLSSEHFAQRLVDEGIDAQVLNASQDANEASIIAQAGEAGRITVATNMAGRGTDIHLGPGVESSGGLHVIVTERNDAARVERQIIGRCARQGESGSYQCYASLEDDIPRQGCRVSILRLLARFARGTQNQLPGWLGGAALDFAQRRLERRHARARRQVEREDERLKTVLSFTGAPE